MSTSSNHYKRTLQKTEVSLSDLVLKVIEKADRGLNKIKLGLGKARDGVKLYQKNPTVFKVGALVVVCLLVYWNRKDAKPESLSAASVTS